MRFTSRTLPLVAFLCSTLSACVELPTMPSAGADVTRASQSAPSSASTAAIISLTNQSRATAGLKALTENPSLDRAAALLCTEIAQSGVWSHSQPSTAYPAPQDRLRAVSYTWAAFGENLAGTNGSDAQHVMDNWMNSADHRANVLQPSFTEIGVAQLQVGAMVCSVQVFGTR